MWASLGSHIKEWGPRKDQLLVWPGVNILAVSTRHGVVYNVTNIVTTDLCSFLLLSKLFFVRKLFNNRGERRHGDVGPGLA